MVRFKDLKDSIERKASVAGPALASAVNQSIAQVEPLLAKATNLNGVKSFVALSESATALITRTTPLLALSPSSIVSVVVISQDQWKVLLDRNVIPTADVLATKMLTPVIASATSHTSAILNNLVQSNKAIPDFLDTVDWKRVRREAIPLAAGGAAFIVTTTLLVPFGSVLALRLIGFGALGPIHHTLASSIQSSIGGTVSSGSSFATAQSIAMGGTLSTLTLVLGGMTVAIPVYMVVRNHLSMKPVKSRL